MRRGWVGSTDLVSNPKLERDLRGAGSEERRRDILRHERNRQSASAARDRRWPPFTPYLLRALPFGAEGCFSSQPTYVPPMYQLAARMRPGSDQLARDPLKLGHMPASGLSEAMRWGRRARYTTALEALRAALEAEQAFLASLLPHQPGAAAANPENEW